MKPLGHIRPCLYLAGAGALLIMASAAQANTISSSSAYAFFSNIPTWTSQYIAKTSGSAEPSYDEENDISDWAGLSSISSDYAQTKASGNTSHAEAHSYSDDIEISEFHGFKFSSDDIYADIDTNGTKSASTSDVKIQVNGTEVTMPGSANPNTTLASVFADAGHPNLLDGTGISGFINEQGSNFVNAVHIILDGFDANGAIDPVSGDLVFGHVAASMDGSSMQFFITNANSGNPGTPGNPSTAVPAPSGIGIVLLFTLGLSGIGAACITERRRSK